MKLYMKTLNFISHQPVRDICKHYSKQNRKEGSRTSPSNHYTSHLPQRLKSTLKVCCGSHQTLGNLWEGTPGHSLEIRLVYCDLEIHSHGLVEHQGTLEGGIQSGNPGGVLMGGYGLAQIGLAQTDKLQMGGYGPAQKLYSLKMDDHGLAQNLNNLQKVAKVQTEPHLVFRACPHSCEDSLGLCGRTCHRRSRPACCSVKPPQSGFRLPLPASPCPYLPTQSRPSCAVWTSPRSSSLGRSHRSRYRRASGHAKKAFARHYQMQKAKKASGYGLGLSEIAS